MTHPLDPVGSLDRLPTQTGIVSRQVSPENPTGAKGMACLALPDPSDPDLPHSAASIDLGRGWKVRPFLALPAGQTVALADIAGPATITHLWFTSDVLAFNALILRIWWDEDPEPAIEVPVGAFFAMGHDDAPHTVTSIPVTVGPSRGCVCYWPMPFRRRARIDLENTGPQDSKVIAYRVAYREEAVAADAGYFHAAYRRSIPRGDRPEHVILDGVLGRGVYVGTSIAWTARSAGWWGEGEIKFFIDGDGEFPTIADTGTEDYFGGAWAFGLDAPIHAPGERTGELPFSGPYSGCPLVNVVTRDGMRRSSLYRWHIPDPIGFREDLRITVQSLGWYPTGRYRPRDDDIASVAYWYQEA
jgi:Protein of unknown function (DUF2961)